MPIKKQNKIDFNAEVSKTAELVLQNYSLNPSIRKILDLLIVDAKRQGYIEQENVYKIDELAKYLGIELNYAYTDLRKLSDAMQMQLVEAVTIDKEGKTKVVVESFISKSIYADGYLTLMLSDTVLKRLANGKAIVNATLAQGLQIKDSNEIRLFEIFCALADTEGIFTVELVRLKKMMKLENKYKTNRDFINYVIEKSKKSLAIKMNFYFEYTKEKTGRAFTHIKVKISDKYTKFISRKFICLSSENARKLLHYGLQQNIIVKLDQEELLTNDRISRNIVYCLDYQNKRAVDSFGGLLTSAIREDWGAKSEHIIEKEEKIC